MEFEIIIDDDAIDELAKLKKYVQRTITTEIESQLAHQPDSASKNRKILKEVEAGFEFEPPLWELRVGEYRVFYDVDRNDEEVHVRAIRHKPPDKRTKDILQ